MEPASALSDLARWAEAIGIRDRPPWAPPVAPDPSRYLPIECHLAGVLATLSPFDQYHPIWALPVARAFLDAMDTYWSEDA